MTRVFADSFFFFALLNPRDAAHAKAVDFSRRNRGALLTTVWVLTELADGLASTPRRQAFRQVLADIEARPANLIVPANPETFERGVDFYNARPDKEWSLTDCISFVVMADERVAEALTGDRHFEQAGFVALLKQAPPFQIQAERHNGDTPTENPSAKPRPSKKKCCDRGRSSDGLHKQAVNGE
jgi:predicted nucleic acid-binding protein